MSSANPTRRSERARTAILEAALELCGEQGYERTTMEGIAKLAGVGKQTIYRWWPSKAAVLQEALNEHASVTAFPDTGDLRADLRTQMTGVARLFNDPRFKPYFQGIIAAAQSDPAVAESLVSTMIGPRVQACRERLERAVEQGQLRDDVDLDEVIELLYSPMYYRSLLHTRPVTTEQAERIIDLAFSGLAPAS